MWLPNQADKSRSMSAHEIGLSTDICPRTCNCSDASEGVQKRNSERLNTKRGK